MHFFFFFLHTFTFQLLDKPWSQVSSLLLPGSCLQFLSRIVFGNPTVHRVLRTHALALSASQFVHKEKSQRIYTSMHSAGLELTKLTYTRLEDNLIRHRGDRYIYTWEFFGRDVLFFSLDVVSLLDARYDRGCTTFFSEVLLKLGP